METATSVRTIGQQPTSPAQFLFGRTLRQRQARLGLLFILPVLVYALILLVFTTAFTVVLTFFGWKVQTVGPFAGLSYYHATFADPIFWHSLANSFLLALLSVPATMLVALLAALALQSSRQLPFRTIFRLVYFLPVVTSMVAVAYVWKWLYNPSYGLINQALAAVHLPTQLWLESNVLVLPSLAVIYLWARFGFDMLIFIAGLEGIPVAYYEAARIDGAGKGRALWHITLPLLNPQFVLVGILDTIGALNIFDLPYAATAGGPGDASRTAVMYLYDTAFTFFNFGKSAVSTLVLFVLITALTLVQRRLVARHVEY